MSRMARQRGEWEKQEEERKKREQASSKPTDSRNVASRVFDTLNPADSGRSWTTEKPSEEGSEMSGGDQAKRIASNLFGGTEKVIDSVEALTGVTQRRMEDLDKQLADKKITRAEYNKKLKEMQKDTEWAGTEDKGTGDRLKKAAGVAAQATSEFVPVGKGVQAGKALKEGAGKGVSRMARLQDAGEVAGKSAGVGAAGTTGAVASDDSIDLGTNEGRTEAGKQIAGGTLTSALLGGAGSMVGSSTSRLLPDERGSIQSYKGKIGDDLRKEVDRGKVSGEIETVPAKSLQLGSDTVGDVDELTVTDYANRMKRGDEIDPIVVTKGTDGMDYIEDGKHRFMAAQQAGIQDIPIVRKQDNVALPDKVEPPTVDNLVQTTPVRAMAAEANTGESITAPVQLKVLDDVQREADVRTAGGVDVPAGQRTETRTQRGAQYIVDDIDDLQKKTGLELVPVDRQLAGKLSGEVNRSGWDEFKDKMGKNFQDTLTVATRTIGRPGTDFVHNMLKGNKFKRDALEALRDDMNSLASLNKKLSTTSKRDIGARVGKALDDRENAQQYLKTPTERSMFDHYVKVFDYIKQLREKADLETIENYRPWVNMKEASEPPMWLAENITTKRTNTKSRFSKERTATEVGENVDNNLADMIYGYVNSQLNELAYDAPVRKFKGDFDNMAAGNKANVGRMNEGVDYLRTMVEQAVNPQRKGKAHRGADKLTSNVYGSILPFNLRLAFQNKTQKFVANSRVSRGAQKLAKQMNDSDVKDLEGGLVFGDQTVYGQLEDVNPTGTGKVASKAQKVKKIDPYQRSEKNNVLDAYRKGAAQAIMDTDQYKTAVKSGMKRSEAVTEALKDPAVREAAIRRGNVVVNDTQFGASPLARPEMLREEGLIWGVIPKKTLYMFSRFPIGMSQHVLETFNNKNTRALELLKNGDPRAMSVSEMRTNYGALLDSMKDAQKAVKEGTDVGIPQDVLAQQIKSVGDNLKIIDKEAKKLSQIRTGKTLKNVGKMWAAATAIQIIFDGGIQSFADDPIGTTAEAGARTNPTLSNRVVGQYSPLASISTSASPLDRRGNINERAIANYIPGVGLAVNRGRDIKNLINSLVGEEEE